MRRARAQILKAIFILCGLYIFFVYFTFKTSNEEYAQKLKEIEAPPPPPPDIVHEINRENARNLGNKRKRIEVEENRGVHKEAAAVAALDDTKQIDEPVAAQPKRIVGK
jgi:hypothetical protein